MHDHVQEKISELLPELIIITLLDGIKRFVSLLDEKVRNALVRLLTVPGTVSTQYLHQPDK
jgi:hypothetical protein